MPISKHRVMPEVVLKQYVKLDSISIFSNIRGQKDKSVQIKDAREVCVTLENFWSIQCFVKEYCKGSKDILLFSWS